ncbi:MAG: GNAT family N-acetyltransferase [Anaerocolumna sp.]
MLKAVIFDMDGVLIDSEPIHAKAHVKAFESIHVSIPLSYCYKFIGSTTSHMLSTVIKDYSLSYTVEELLILYHRTLAEIIRTEGHIPIPYVVNTIKDLHKNGLKLAIASSSSEEEIKDVVNYLGVTDCFDALVSGTTVTNPKPAPDVFIKAANQLGVSNLECLIIEDSYNGTKAGCAAGIPVIGFQNMNSGNQDLGKACYLIEGFEEIDYHFLNKIYKRYYKEALDITSTQRLRIRELTYEDSKILASIFHNNLGKTSNFNMLLNDSLKAYIDNVYSFYDYGLWGVYLKENDILIGLCGIQLLERNGISEYELSYLIDFRYQGLSYGYEAVTAVMEYGFQTLNLKRMTAYILPDNTGSIRIAEKTGMQLESVTVINDATYLLYVITNESE